MPKEGKKYYRIGEVSRITGVEPHVLRYWENEFKSIRPRRIAKQRLYRRQDIQIIKFIKSLLHEEGFTIAGAKKRLKQDLRKRSTKATGGVSGDMQSVLAEVRKGLLEIRDLLD